MTKKITNKYIESVIKDIKIEIPRSSPIFNQDDFEKMAKKIRKELFRR